MGRIVLNSLRFIFQAISFIKQLYFVKHKMIHTKSLLNVFIAGNITFFKKGKLAAKKSSKCSKVYKMRRYPPRIQNNF